MFDTIKLHVPLHLSDLEMECVPWTRTNSTQNHRQDFARTWFKHVDGQGHGPHLVYTYRDDPSFATSLKIEVSIPKFLYGNNVTQFLESDVELFFRHLRGTVANMLHVPILQIPDLHRAEVEKLHVCYNFSVGNQLEDYLLALSTVTIPKYVRNVYGDGTSVYWDAKTRTAKFYSKYHELLATMSLSDRQKHPELLQMAEGVLRLEIELSFSDLTRHNVDRFAGELLDFEWAAELLQGWLKEIGFSVEVGINPVSHWVTEIDRSDLTDSQKTSLISYISRLWIHGRQWVAKHYPGSTYHRQRSLIKRVFGTSDLAFSDVPLPPLKVDVNALRRVYPAESLG